MPIKTLGINPDYDIHIVFRLASVGILGRERQLGVGKLG